MMLVIFALIGLASAQSTVTLTGPATARAGETVALTVNLTGSSAAGPAAMQFTFGVPSNWTLSAPSGSSRFLNCGFPSSLICAVWAQSRDPHPNGKVMDVQLKLPDVVSPGNYSIALTAPVAANTAVIVGSHSLAVGSPHSIRVLHKADVNGDGNLTLADALMITQQAVGLVSCTADQNGDGKCDAIDIQIVVSAIIAGG
jgi:hypothetical protein